MTLERLAEGELPSSEESSARAHIADCVRCAAEFEAYETLFARLGDLPRFAPSAAFADAVMSRVELAPQESAVLAWLRRLVPTTRRGWAVIGSALVVPAMPIIAIVMMLITQPLLTPTTLGQWGLLRFESMSQAMMAWLYDRSVNSGLYGFAENGINTLQTLPMSALGVTIALLAVAIPLSAWGLVRLTRTPMRSVNYAN